MKRGDKVRWRSSDSEGNFTHIGVVTDITEKTVSIKTLSGLFTVPHNDGSFEVIKNAGDARAELVDQEEVVAAKPVPSRKQGSKIERAVAIARSMPHATQKELIAMFMEQLDMTKAGATTYYYNVKKKL